MPNPNTPRGLLSHDATLAELLDTAEVGGYEWDLDSGALWINERWATMLGYCIADVLPLDQEKFMALVHPEDRQGLLAAVSAYARDPSDFFVFRYRLRCADGNWAWVKTRGRIRQNAEAGQVLAGVNLDISHLMGELISQQQVTEQLDELLRLSPSVLYASSATYPYQVYYLSANCQGTLQVDPERMQAKGGWLDLVHPEDRARLEQALANWADNPVHTVETLRYRLQRQDGTYTWVRDTCQQIRGEDGRAQLTGSIVGIDEQVQKEELLNRIVGVVPGMIYQFRMTANGHMDYPFVSPKIVEIFGLTPAQVRHDARPVLASIHPDDRLTVLSSIQRSATTLDTWQQDFRASRDGLSYRWVRGHAVPHRQDDGVTFWHGQILDIHALKQTEASLRASEARLERAQQIARLGHWEYQSQTGEVFWSPMVYRIFGLENTMTVTAETFTQHLHPDDRPHVQQAEAEAKATGFYAVEHRIVRHDGDIRWIKQQAQVEPAASGGFRFYGTVLDITAQKELEQELMRLSNTDSLTGLYNRRYLMDAGQQAIERARRNSEPVSMLLMDIDYFKAINDTYGHATGDNVIARVGTLLQAQTRNSDVAARLGGEEFALVLENTTATSAFHVAEQLRQAVSQEDMAPAGQDPLQITVSIGIASAQADHDNLEGLLSRADNALYVAKNEGRNRTVFAPAVAPDAARDSS